MSPMKKRRRTSLSATSTESLRSVPSSEIRMTAEKTTMSMIQDRSEQYFILPLIVFSLWLSLLTTVLVVVFKNRTYREIVGLSIYGSGYRGNPYCTKEYCVTKFYDITYANAKSLFSMPNQSTYWPQDLIYDGNLMQVACPQVNSSVEQAEDCLNMNLFMPSEVFENIHKYRLSIIHNLEFDNNTFAPLIVILPGGNFLTGSAESEEYRNVHKLAARSKAVVAVISYRVGPFGFLRWDNKKRKSLGIADIKAAIQWLFEFSEYLGINKERITVVGGGNAAAIAAMILLSRNVPTDKALANTFIFQSGSPFNPDISRSVDDSKTFDILCNKVYNFSKLNENCLNCLDCVKFELVTDAVAASETPIIVRPRIGKIADLKRPFARALFGLTFEPLMQYRSTSTFHSVLEIINPYLNSSTLTIQDLSEIYGHNESEAASFVLQDFFVTCPTYHFVSYLQSQYDVHVHIYLFDGEYSSAEEFLTIPIDHLVLVDERSNFFSEKRLSVKFARFIRAFIDDSTVWEEWSYGGNHIVFDGNYYEKQDGFRENICAKWTDFYTFPPIDALL